MYAWLEEEMGKKKRNTNRSSLSCAFVGCENRRASCPAGTVFHRFPGDPNVCAKWEAIVSRKEPDNSQLTPWTSREHSAICSEHFKSDAYRLSMTTQQPIRRLKPGSIPEILPSCYYPSYRRSAAAKSAPPPPRRRQYHAEGDVDFQPATLNDQHQTPTERYTRPVLTYLSYDNFLLPELQATSSG